MVRNLVMKRRADVEVGGTRPIHVWFTQSLDDQIHDYFVEESMLTNRWLVIKSNFNTKDVRFGLLNGQVRE